VTIDPEVENVPMASALVKQSGSSILTTNTTSPDSTEFYTAFAIMCKKQLTFAGGD
jgi:hypothetical protein